MTATLADMTEWDPDLQVSTMDEAIKVLRANGRSCRLHLEPKGFDGIIVEHGGREFLFTPWFFEVPSANFAACLVTDDGDPGDEYDNLRVAFDDGRGLARVIEEWLATL